MPIIIFIFHFHNRIQYNENPSIFPLPFKIARAIRRTLAADFAICKRVIVKLMKFLFFQWKLIGKAQEEGGRKN